MAKPRGRCVYCGRFDVTKQHVWPVWLAALLPRDAKSNSQMLVGMAHPVPGLAVIQTRLETRRGDAGSRTIRNVCGQCNGGWMSRLEIAAKPLLADLILGNRVALDATAQHILAAWITMFCITAEFTDRAQLGIPASDRVALKESSQPLDRWRIFIGRYHGTEWRKRYSHCGLEFRLFLPAAGEKIGTAQCSTFVAGELVVYAYSWSHANNAINDFLDPVKNVQLQQIWPLQLSPLDSHAVGINEDVALQLLAQNAHLSLAERGQWTDPRGAKQ